MKLGIIGAGNIVHAFLEIVHELHSLELTGICAVPDSEETLKQLCQTYNIPLYDTDAEHFLQNQDMEVVYIAVPNHLHFHFAKQAMETGRHVICEKPLTSNIREAKELADISAKTGKFLFEAVTTHYLPNALQIKKDLKELGSIKIMTMNYSQYSSRYNAFKAGNTLPAFDPEMSGGALMDLNIYNINFAVMLFGAPKSVNYQANIIRGIDTSGILTMDYGSFKCVCIAAKDCKAPIAATIQGDKGCIYIPSALNSLTQYKIMMNQNNRSQQMKIDDSEYLNFNGTKSRLYHEFETFINIIKENNQKEADRILKNSLIAMQIQTEARESAGIVFAAD